MQENYELEAQLVDTKDIVVQLNEKLALAKAELSARMSKNNSLEKVSKERFEKLEAMKGATKNLSDEISRNKLEFQKLKKDLKQGDKEIFKLQNKVDNFKDTVRKTKDEKNTKNRELLNLKKELKKSEKNNNRKPAASGTLSGPEELSDLSPSILPKVSTANSLLQTTPVVTQISESSALSTQFSTTSQACLQHEPQPPPDPLPLVTSNSKSLLTLSPASASSSTPTMPIAASSSSDDNSNVLKAMLTEHFDALTKNMENHCKKFGDEVDALAKKFEDPNLF